MLAGEPGDRLSVVGPQRKMPHHPWRWVRGCWRRIEYAERVCLGWAGLWGREGCRHGCTDDSGWQFVFHPEGDGQPVECLEEWFGWVKTGGPKKQKFVNAEPLEVLLRDPREKSAAVVQPGGDKGPDGFYGIRQGGYEAEFDHVQEMEKRS